MRPLCYIYSSGRPFRSAISTVVQRRCRKLKLDMRKATNSRRYSVYSWGTSKNGTIPVSEVVDEERKLAAETVGGSIATGGGAGGGGIIPTKTRSHVIDHPRKVDTHGAFGTSASVSQYFCGAGNTGAILSDGSCLVWGANESGQLGLGHKREVCLPVRLYPPDSENGKPLVSSLQYVDGIRHLALGKSFSAVIDSDGNLHTFGFGGSAFSGMGWLGHGDGEECLVPKRVESLIEDGCEVKDVVVGENHMTVLTTEGEVLTAGCGSYGRLGNLETSDDQLFLEPVELLGGEKTKQIAGGHAFTLALTGDGVVHGWGRNDKGQLGTGGGLMVDMYSLSSLPTPIEGRLENQFVAIIAAGHSHSACITDRGELYMWGATRYLEPELMTSLLHTMSVDVACGENYSVALTKDEHLYSFGKGKTGVLGLASVKKTNQPTLVEGLVDQKVVRMSAGYTHFACLVEGRGGDDGTAAST